METEQLSDLLNAAQSGDSDASRSAYEHVYAELKRTAAVENRAHFHSLAARAMRQILVDHARNRDAEKRGGNSRIADFDRALSFEASDSWRALELDSALRSLEACDADLAQRFKWHFFAGLNFEEIAEETDRHKRTVYRDWEVARAFLRRELGAKSA